ncbi:MAG TPA: threonine ammonia-lyase [Acidimicrobiales bacterium]|nr:threonine ammonia-lyase [Acidimicrobiales bacterium]
MRSPTGPLPVTDADVVRAAAALGSDIVRTPTLLSQTLSAITGANLWLKFENLQYTASFKDRGALYRLLQLDPAERQRGVLAVSAGNHAQGVAYHASRLGIPATIVMPRSTPNIKVASTEALGARVVLHGDDLAAAHTEAEALAAGHGLVWIAPFDDIHVIAGQGTVGLELFADVPDLDVVVVPVGGGGLLAGIAVVAAARAPQVELIGVETELYPSMTNVVHGGGEVPGGPTIAEGIAVARCGSITTEIVTALVDDVVAVPEATIEQAVNLLLEIEKTVAEGAGAAGLAAVLAAPEHFKGRDVGLIVTGGNIDPRLLASIIMRGLVRSGRLSRLSVRVDDAPGSLGRVAAIVGELRGNIVEVSHQRLFSDLSVKNTMLELAIETRDREHADRIVEALEDAGYPVRRGEPT